MAPPTLINQRVSRRRSVAWSRLSLSGVRDIARGSNTTINEVVLALVSTVLRDLMAARGSVPDRPLIAMVPLSLRDESGGDDGNRVTCILCNLATDEPLPIRRLQTIAASSRDGKRLVRSMSKDAATAYSMALAFPAIMAQMAGFAHRFPLPFNVVVSNVPGPRESLYLNGAELEAIYPVSALFERQSLNITLVSSGDQLNVGMVGCERALPDLPDLVPQLEDAYDELRHLVLGDSRAKVGLG